MKFKRLYIMALMYLCLATLFYSCSKVGCTDRLGTNYDSNAKKDDGSCVFPFAPFLGTYTMYDTLHKYGGETYSQTILVITKNTTSGQKMNIQLHNDALLEADISGYTFTIPSQNAGGTVYSGQGTLSGNNLNLTYHIFDKEYVTSSGQKQ